jgi:hypothetical protein
MSETVQEKGKSNKSKIFLGLAVLFLLGIVGLIFWIIPMRKEYEEMIAEKEIQKQEIKQNLDDMISRRDSIKVLYGELSDSLLVKDSIIEQNAKEIRKLLNYKWEYRKVNKKLAKLRVITQDYVSRMDSLYNANEELHVENKRIKKQYSEEMKKNEDLTKTKEALEEKVENAAVLKGSGITISTIRFTRSGRAKETNKASKVKRIKLCFNLTSNPLVENGFKQLYVRISKPNQEIMMKSESDKYTFTYMGSTMQYTSNKDFQYTGEDQEICISYLVPKKDQPLEAGKYIATLYLDDHVIGEKSFELK